MKNQEILNEVYEHIKKHTIDRYKNSVMDDLKEDEYIIADIFMYWSRCKFVKYLFVKSFIEYDVFAKRLQSSYHLNGRETNFVNVGTHAEYTSEKTYQRGFNDIKYDDILSRISTRNLIRTLYVIEKSKGDIVTNKHEEKLNELLDIMKEECLKRGVDLNNFNYRDYLPKPGLKNIVYPNKNLN